MISPALSPSALSPSAPSRASPQAYRAPRSPHAPNTSWTILLNRHSGVVHAETHLEQLQQMIAEADLDADLVATASTQELRERLRTLAAGGAEHVAIAGGDGTVAQAAQELAYTDTALGIIPLGTFNNFAAALRLPGDLPSALQVLKWGSPYAVDLGRVDGHYFTEVAGVGLFADFIAANGAGKHPLRALYAALRAFVPLKSHPLRLVVDGEVVEEQVVLCEVANTYRVGPAMSVAPGAWLSDGKLELILVGDIEFRDVIRYGRAAWSQMLQSLPKVRRLQATEVRLEAPQGMHVHVDDQFSLRTPVTISVEPQALKVLVDGVAGL